MHIIKQYTNRKLYSQKLKQYINHKRLIKLIQEDNDDFVILDNQTRENISEKVFKSLLRLLPTTYKGLLSAIRNSKHE